VGSSSHDRDVPIAGSGASALDAALDGGDEGLLVRRLRWHRAVADHDERSRRVQARPAQAVGVVVRVPARDDGTDPPREVVEDGAARLEQPEAGNSWLGVSPSPYQPKRMPPSPSPCPGPGLRPVMKPSTETASEVKTLPMATDARGGARWAA
jgi:hypothetical protein